MKALSLALITALTLNASQFGDVNLTYGKNKYDISKWGGFYIAKNELGYSGYDAWYAYNDSQNNTVHTSYDINNNYVDFQKDVDMNALEVWKMGVFGKDVKVGFIEGSYDTKNPDISYVEGLSISYDSNKSDVDYRDIKGDEYGKNGVHTVHGLETTSTLVGKHDDFGAAGIAPKAKLYLGAINKNLEDYVVMFSKLFDWFHKKGVRVVNISMSFGSYLNKEADTALIKKMKEYEKKGMIFVTSAGNDNTEGIIDHNYDYILEKGGALHIGAIWPNGERWTRYDGYGSNFGGFLDFVAPTVLKIDEPLDFCSEKYSDEYDIEYCKTNGYTTTNGGTSLSTPLVAGTIAMMLEVNPDLNTSEVKDILAKTAIKLGTDKFPLNTGKTYNYKTCKMGDDENASYDVWTLDNSYNGEVYKDGKWYYPTHPNPYDTALCKKYTWNKYMGYGLVDSEGAVRESINRIKSADRAKALLEKNKLGYYHFPKAVLAKLGEIGGVDYTNYYNINNLLNYVKSFSDTNWHLVSADKDTNVNDLINAGVKEIFVYRNNKWYAKAKGTTFLPNGVEALQTIKRGEGVWVKSLYHVPQTPMLSNSSLPTNNLLENIKAIKTENSYNDDAPKWYLFGANKDTNTSDLITNSVKVIWSFRNNKWYVKTKENYDIPDSIGKLDSINANEGVWVLE